MKELCDYFCGLSLLMKKVLVSDFDALWLNFRMKFLIMDHSAKDDIFLIYVGTFLNNKEV